MASLKLRAPAPCLTQADLQAKISEVRGLIGPALTKFPTMSSDASILRFLRARNWNSKKAAKMLKETLKWRMDYKPEMIRWEHIAREGETGKVYKAHYTDKIGRTVLVMRPGFQNTSKTDGQIRYLVYCMENAVLDLKPGQQQMVWLIDFCGWNMSSISVKTTQETARVLQNRYPERLALAILYNPPKLFESFWTMVKPFLERKTHKKVRFVYAENPESRKIMEELFEKDKLEAAFGGSCGTQGFDYKTHSQRMKEDDKKMMDFIKSGAPLPSDQNVQNQSEPLSPESPSAGLYEDDDDDDDSSDDDNSPSSVQHIRF
ncbi:PREDICTED: random slug protein 5-like [Ipomoea nil]|uniref:random slug protein 5-like n=1 Tax=Ipomoea nil TaxID=35883 RepID=UPI0009018C6A|nr:PREDICTED: random slug protein 5-like [Ipomoea nil]